MSDQEEPNTAYEFTAIAKVSEPPKAVRCQLGYDKTPYTVAGTMAEETNAEIDFRLTVAKARLKKTETFNAASAVQMICTADGVAASHWIDQSTGEVLSAGESPKPSQIPPADAPAVQINVTDFSESTKASRLGFVVTVEGGTADAMLDCTVSNSKPQTINESATLAGGTEEHEFSVDLSAEPKMAEYAGYLNIECETEGGMAYEAVAPSKG